jgi:hypothetical protein
MHSADFGLRFDCSEIDRLATRYLEHHQGTGCNEELKEYRRGHVKARTEPHDVFFREFAFPIQYIRDDAFGHEHVNQVFLA